MSEPPQAFYDYQIEGGALLLDAATYVRRKADDELYNALKMRKFCYVLNARQMGKSSLKVRTMQRLQIEGFACAAVDLQGIGTSATEEQWYVGIIRRIASPLGLRRQFDLDAWWKENHLLSCVDRFSLFLEKVLLSTIAQPITIFIDEIDLTLSLTFNASNFFGVLRECYNRRADEPEFRRLTFALLGVGTPADLIQNKQATPFNIGQQIDLTGFQLEEAKPLIPGLADKSKNPQSLLQAVLSWTGGQPFLTQKICKLLLTTDSTPTDGQESAWVAQMVQTKVIDNWEAQDTPQHLITIRDRLLRREEHTGRLLGLYKQIVQQGEIEVDDSPDQMELRMTGLVVKRDGRLRIYNSIYAEVFTQDWLEKALTALRPYASSLDAWEASDRRDESKLLRGQALQDAQAWAVGKSLSNQDHQFLSASEKLDKLDIQKKLETEERAKRQLRSRMFAAIVLVSTVVSVLFVDHQVKQEDQERVKYFDALRASGKFDECITQASIVPESFRLYAQIRSQLSECQLSKAENLADNGKLKDAIALASEIVVTQKVKPNEPSYQRAQITVKQWAERLIQQATDLYQKGKKDDAISLLEILPLETSIQKRFQQTVSHWHKEWLDNETLLKKSQIALANKEWTTALEAAEEVKSPNFLKQQAQAIIKQVNTNQNASIFVSPSPTTTSYSEPVSRSVIEPVRTNKLNEAQPLDKPDLGSANPGS